MWMLTVYRRRLRGLHSLLRLRSSYEDERCTTGWSDGRRVVDTRSARPSSVATAAVLLPICLSVCVCPVQDLMHVLASLLLHHLVCSACLDGLCSDEAQQNATAVDVVSPLYNVAFQFVAIYRLWHLLLVLTSKFDVFVSVKTAQPYSNRRCFTNVSFFINITAALVLDCLVYADIWWCLCILIINYNLMSTLLMQLTTVMLEPIESSRCTARWPLQHAALLQITDYRRNDVFPLVKCIRRYYV